MKPTLTVEDLRVRCGICKHRWIPRKTPVYRCPNCFSSRWNEAAERKADEQLAQGEKIR